MITRRTFSALLGAASIGSLMPKSAQAETHADQTLCNKCGRFAPNHLILMRSNNQGNDDWWRAAIGTQYAVLCLVCVDHRICYPYFEQVYFALPGAANETPGEMAYRKLHINVNMPDDPWYRSMLTAKHDCCMKDLLNELNQFYGQ